MKARLTPLAWTTSLILTALIAILWGFPKFWYKQAQADERLFWLTEKLEVGGCKFQEIPVAESAERLLAADASVNGEFTTPDKRFIRVFSAKRFEEREHEIGLFMHTPDRCWVQAGWKILPTDPDHVELDLHGRKIPFERRVFAGRHQRELVYFTGLVGGRPLPYRLDHNLSISTRLQEKKSKRDAAARVSDSHFWTRLLESFTNRRELFGPKQFIRISTPILGEDISAADERLRKFIPEWLEPGNFVEEKQARLTP